MNAPNPAAPAVDTNALAAAVAAALQSRTVQPTLPGFGAPGGWTGAPTGFSMQPVAPVAAVPAPTGLLIPITSKLPDGREATVYLSFPAEAASNPQTIAALCAQFAQLGILKAWAPRQSDGGGQGGGGGNGYGGGGGYRGGYGGGGGYRGGRY